jgi:carboxypeptidase C (cathepsin A)
VSHSYNLRQEIDDDNPIHINPGPDPFENKTDPFSPFNPENNQNETEPVGPEKNKTDPIGPEKNKTDPIGPEKNHTDEDPSKKSKVNATVFMNETFYTGYMPINVEEKEYLYFVMVESRNDPDSDPLIIWL